MGWLRDSPLFWEILADKTRRDILIILEDRFGSVPDHMVSGLRAVLDLEKLDELIVLAATCSDLQVFVDLLPGAIDRPFVVAASNRE